MSGKAIVGLKAVAVIAPVHGAQLLAHRKLAGCGMGLPVHIEMPALSDGIKRRTVWNILEASV
jgi:hypothetical protein